MLQSHMQMANPLPLHALYQAQPICSDVKSAINRACHSYLVGHEAANQDIIDLPRSAIRSWKDLLLLNLIYRLLSLPQGEVHRLSTDIRLLLRQPWNEQSQYQRSLVALNYALADLPVPAVSPHLLESGAAPIELEEFRSWLAVPYIPYHAEFGTFLALLSRLTGNVELQETAIKIAQWHFNTLDASFHPFTGLFVQEADGSAGCLLGWNYLLFHALGQLSGYEHFETAAQRQLDYLSQLKERGSLCLDPLMPLLELQLRSSQPIGCHPFNLPAQIYDPANALVGWRSPEQNVVFTLHGGHTGLGCFHLKDTAIISYGPQYLPLDDCRGFGIEGNDLSDKEMRKSTVEWGPQGFRASGCVRFVDQPTGLQPPSPYSLGLFRGIWIEVDQILAKNQVHLNANFLSLDGWESVAFSFFIQAQACRVGEEQVNLRSLSRYQGAIKPLLAEGAASSFQLQALHQHGSMQVIPLGGGNNFWGADFLVSYVLDPSESRYRWQITPTDKS